MTKNQKKWLLLGGATLAAIFLLTYVRPFRPKVEDEETGDGGTGGNGLITPNALFTGADGRNSYVRPQNLIPNVYGRYDKYDSHMNATGSFCPELKTIDLQDACKCAAKSKTPPTVLADFR